MTFEEIQIELASNKEEQQRLLIRQFELQAMEDAHFEWLDGQIDLFNKEVA